MLFRSVRDFQLYVGLASPMDFNGMVRHYFLRSGSNVAEIRVNLAPKEERVQQSHVILLRIRDDLTRLARTAGANVKLVEVPPGPPVLATVTAEVYGPVDEGYDKLIAAGRRVEERLAREPGIVDVDISAEDDQRKLVFEADQPKAALSGVSKENIAETLKTALQGLPATVLEVPGEVDPLSVELRVNRSQRSAEDDLRQLYVRGRQGEMVQIGALGEFKHGWVDKTIYHKNLRRVVFVYAEVAGRPPADAIVDIQFDRESPGVREQVTGEREQVSALSPQSLAPSPQPPTSIPVAQRTWFSPGGGDPLRPEPAELWCPHSTEFDRELRTHPTETERR